MAKKELLTLLQAATVEDLKELLALKKDLIALEKKQKELLKQFASVSKDIGSLQTSYSEPGRKTKKKKGTRKTAKRKRAAQPPLSSLIAEVLKEKKKPVGVNEICEALLQEKRYRTKAKNFKANVRILLYKNEQGLYKKVGPGRFRLARAKKK